ncbi:MAG: AEC family transporter [Synechococcaceae cyanobacterium SM2_3_1]|nr:AEC family transporter [Synechococcaceae cyanobacterium SM2_3_1]
MFETLIGVYLPLLGWAGLGLLLQKGLPLSLLTKVGPHQLGRFLYWVGVPLSIMGFLRQADLNGQEWLAPLVCWVAVALAAALALFWVLVVTPQGKIPAESWLPPEQGSFHLTSMLGNTGYIGFPVCLAVGGTHFFGWAVFYDLGNLLCSYGLGVWIANYYSRKPGRPSNLAFNVLRNPSIAAFVLGLWLNPLDLPNWLDQGLQRFAWGMVGLSLILLGMRLAQISRWQYPFRAGTALLIKLILVPGLVSLLLLLLPIPDMGKLILALQAGMPPAIATLVLTEEYGLDREMTIATMTTGYLAALISLPLWAQLWSLQIGGSF